MNITSALQLQAPALGGNAFRVARTLVLYEFQTLKIFILVCFFLIRLSMRLCMGLFMWIFSLAQIGFLHALVLYTGADMF